MGIAEAYCRCSICASLRRLACASSSAQPPANKLPYRRGRHELKMLKSDDADIGARRKPSRCTWSAWPPCVAPSGNARRLLVSRDGSWECAEAVASWRSRNWRYYLWIGLTRRLLFLAEIAHSIVIYLLSPLKLAREGEGISEPRSSICGECEGSAWSILR